MKLELGARFPGWTNNSGLRVSQAAITAAFAHAAALAPDTIALAIGRTDGAPERLLTFGELQGQAEHLARMLVADGVRPGDRVGLATHRDFDVVTGMLGILTAGAVYVPLDLTYPKSQLDFMQRDSGMKRIVLSHGLSLELASPDIDVIEIGATLPEAIELPLVRADDAAYVIYTSGSTGQPKGVVAPHRAVVGLTVGANYTAFGPDRRILQMAPVSFDAATFEIWGALLNGGTCVIYPDAGLPDFARLRAVLANAEINTLWLTSTLFNAIVDADIDMLAGVEELLIGGEALSVEHVRKAGARLKANLVNGYGPTETTTFACCYRIPRELPLDLRSVPIGRPIHGVAVAIFNRNLEPTAVGEVGELCIAGDGLALGYLNRPELTGERFVLDPDAPFGRFYRTGDQARWLPNGEVEFLGRRDQQVKIGGHRIELGEIEHVLRGHPQVGEAAVKVEGASANARRIAAFVVPAEPGAGPSEGQLRAYLEARLPKFMIPSSVVVLEAMPLTPMGKLDRAALSAAKNPRPVLEQAFAPPRGELEGFIAGTWAGLLGLERVGRNDRFFELGGTSLLALRFLEICRRERDLHFTVAEFFDCVSVANLARLRETRRGSVAEQGLVPVPMRAAEDRIAIVGLAGRFAGAPNVARFWDMLLAGRSGRVDITREDLIAAGEDPAQLDDPDYVASAFPLDEAEAFDAAFFGFTPREAELMDPQQRILLEAAWTALEDAGVDPRQGNDRIGVFGGVGRNAYLLNNLMSHAALRETAGDYNMLIGNERDFPATHIAYRLGLRGPAMTVQTACSTSGVAIHVAAESLRKGECDLALAGGSKVLAPNRVGYRYVEGGPLSRGGVLRAFDAQADGMVRGSGAAMVAMKRLDDALADGDHVYAVLIGSAVNNDGDAKAGFTAPSVSGQAAVIAEAHQKAGISADTVSLIEAHGTGTVLGDPIEVEGLTRAFGKAAEETGFCALGSVKTNIGHLDAGATAAGLIKAVLALENEIIPPSLNFGEANPAIGLEASPFFVPTKATDWKRGAKPRRAGVSSFGLGGTNAHLLLEEAPARPTSKPAIGPQLLVLSARTDTALARRCADLADWLEGRENANLADVAYTLLVGRRRFEKRVALVCADRADAIAKLRRMDPAETLRCAGVTESPPVAFLFPGSGSQYAGMAKGLYHSQPEFRAAMDACAAIYDARTRGSLIDLAFADGTLENPTTAQPALFAVEYAMAQTWLAWGVEPDAMIGHSMGEYTAACMAGVFSLEDGMRLVMCRGRLLDSIEAGSMLTVPMPAEVLTARLPLELSIAAINRADQCVVSGPDAAVEAFAQVLEAEGLDTRRVHMKMAAHSSLVDPILDALRDEVRSVTLHPPKRRYVSNLTADWITDDEATDPDYWARHLRAPVRFAESVARLLEDPDRVLLEVGPGQVLSTLARQHTARAAGHFMIASIRHPHEKVGDDQFLATTLGRMWLAGAQPKWAAVAGEARRRLPLPTYPFERTRHWIDAVPFAANDGVAPVTAVAAPGAGASVAAVEATPMTRREQIMAQLVAIICRLSGLPAERIDPHATFLELGFDSLFLTQANAAFKKTFNLRLTTRQLMETTPVLDALASHIDARLPADAVIGSAPVPAAAANAAAPIRSEDIPGVTKVAKSATAELTPAQEAYIDGLIEETIRRTPKAKLSTQASRGVLADPRTVQGFRARWKEIVYPVLSDRAKGSRIWDTDGNEYVDLVSGYGVTFLGHQPDFIVKAIKDQIDRTLAIGPQTVLAGEVARLVSDMTGMERVAFCNTGSEAVLAAVRMARAVTGKSKIAKFDGHYHGIADEFQVRGIGAGSRKTTAPSAPGVPAEAVQNTLILDYGDPEAFDVIRENAADIALVMVEPVRSRNPDFQPREYLHELRRVTEELGIPLMFDEMVTGFRCHPGGAQAIFGVRADIATYGKVAGGGLPIGIVAGSAQYLDSLDGGDWRFGDDSAPPADMTMFAGTFVRHPLALATAKATLEHLKREGPALQEGVNARATKLVAELNAFLKSVHAAMKVEQFASVLRVTFTAHQEYADLLFFELRNRGVLTYEGRPIFLTTAHTDEDMAKVREAFRASVMALINVGLLDGRDATAVRRIPMVTGQQEIWVSAQFSPDASCSYNLCSTLRLKGAFDISLFRGALDDLSQRHEALRTTPDRDALTQTIAPVCELPLVVDDLRLLNPVQRDQRIAAARKAQVSTPFDLAAGPLARCHVLRLSDDEHDVLFCVHHIVSDGWSCGILLRDLGELYAARKAGRPAALEPAQQLSEYVAFLGQAEQKQTRAEARDYWIKLYGGELPRVQIPSDRPRPKTRDYAARRFEMPLDRELVASLRKAARDSGTTLFAALIGGFAAYLSRLTGVADNPVGFSAAGQPLMGGKALVGHCVNFLPLRLSTNVKAGYADHLRGIGATVLDALEHQNFDFLSFIQEIQPYRNADWAPLVSVAVNLDPSAQSLKFADLDVEAGSVGRAYEHLDLFMNFAEIDEDIELQCTFNTALFDEATVRRRMVEYLRLMGAAAAQPETPLRDLPLIGEDDRRQLLGEWNGATLDYPRDASLVSLFRKVVSEHADKTALLVAATPSDTVPSRQVTYAELDRLSDAWAARLAAGGVKRGDLVALLLPRSLDLIVGLLATLKAGAAYVPIASGTPAAAIQRMLGHSDPRALLTTSKLAPEDIPAGLAVIAMDAPQAEVPASPLADVETTGRDPAYVIYTSGSTGEPKGVVVPQRGVSRLVLDAEYARLDASRVLLQLAPISFDISMFEVWGALLNGATLVVPPWEQVSDLARFGEVLKAGKVSLLQITPALFNTVIDECPEVLEGVEEIMIGGDALSVSHTHRALQLLPKTELINVYGPTENAIWSTYYRVPRDFDPHATSVPIGRSVHDSSAFVVDEHMQLVPIGVTGELVVGGDGVASGYLKQPELTQRQFVPDTISRAGEGRLYRTGDYCRHLPDGTIEFLGRRDNQIKIRGFRVELGEIEAALQEVAGLRKAVAVHEPGPDGGRLVAFVVCSDETLTPARLTQLLRDRLARHLTPARIMRVDDLPLSAHGKVDRAALLRLLDHEVEVIEKVAPRTPMERELAAIWADILQRPVESVDESFFNLGGHSLMAVRLFDRVRRSLGADLPISTLFTHPTIHDLAEIIVKAKAQAKQGPSTDWDTTIVIEAGPARPARPLFIVGGAGGNVNNLVDLGRALGQHRPVIGIQTRGIMGHAPRETIEEMATENIRYIRRHQAVGPYVLAGYSAGALTAFEMARQMTAAGEQVAELVLLDTFAPEFEAEATAVAEASGRRLSDELHLLTNYGLPYFYERASAKVSNVVLRGWMLNLLDIVSPTLARSRRSARAWFAAADKYEGSAYGGSASLVLSKPINRREQRIVASHPNLGWDRFIDPAKLNQAVMQCGHLDMVKGEHVADLADYIEQRIRVATGAA